MAFYKVERASMFETLQLLNPSVVFRIRDQLAHGMLDKASSKSMDGRMSRMGLVVSLATDAWTNLRGSPR